MSIIRRALLAAFKALVGAYLGTVLLLLVLVSTTPNEVTRSDLNWDGAVELIRYSVGGVALLSWWIAPIGIAFDFIAKPRMRGWTTSAASLRGGLLGAGLGFATAVIFSMIGAELRSPFVRAAVIFVPIYCAVWCATYARRIAART